MVNLFPIVDSVCATVAPVAPLPVSTEAECLLISYYDILNFWDDHIIPLLVSLIDLDLAR